MNGLRESDSLILPMKSSNKTANAAAEGMEGRGLTRGNSYKQNICRTLGRESMKSALKRVRQALILKSGLSVNTQGRSRMR